MQNSRGPLVIAIAVLLLPLLYVGSYLALVVPGEVVGSIMERSTMSKTHNAKIKYMLCASSFYLWENYRCGDRYGRIVFWPLEQIDRRLRPSAWDPSYGSVPLILPSYAGLQFVEETKPSEPVEE